MNIENSPAEIFFNTYDFNIISLVLSFVPDSDLFKVCRVCKSLNSAIERFINFNIHNVKKLGKLDFCLFYIKNGYHYSKYVDMRFRSGTKANFLSHSMIKFYSFCDNELILRKLIDFRKNCGFEGIFNTHTNSDDFEDFERMAIGTLHRVVEHVFKKHSNEIIVELLNHFISNNLVYIHQALTNNIKILFMVDNKINIKFFESFCENGLIYKDNSTCKLIRDNIISFFRSGGKSVNSLANVDTLSIFAYLFKGKDTLPTILDIIIKNKALFV